MSKSDRNGTTRSPWTHLHRMATNYQPMTLDQLKLFLTNGLTSQDGPAKLSQGQAAAHVLGIEKSPYIVHEVDAQVQDALIVGLDMEWYEAGPKQITEIGISILPVSQAPLSKPIHALNKMEVHYLRPKDTAHMVNGEKCPGHPEAFEFGMTCFVDAGEAKQALTDSFLQYTADAKLRPIVLCGQAVDNDIDMLRESFGIDLEAWGVIVMVLDTQVMAQELGMNSRRPMSLKKILRQYCVEEEYLHNAGNDIAQTMVAASLLAGEVATRRGRYAPDNQVDVDNLKALLRNRSTLSWGTALFCTNCNSTEHLVGHCPNAYLCTRCANVAIWKHLAHTHPVEKCVRPAFPCSRCIESTDTLRQHNAMTHYVEDCRVESTREIEALSREVVHSMKLLLVR